MGSCRIGLIGAGNVAQRHARVLAGFADVRLVGVTDVLPDACQRLAGQHDAPAYPDVATLLDAGLDAAYVCVPPFAHGPAEEAVIAAGLPMFVEKPLAADLDTAERIAALVAERGVLTSVGHHWRYLPFLDQARDLLAGRSVRMVGGAWLDKVPPVTWWSRRELSGGPVVEQAAHVLDLLRFFAGEVIEVSAYGDGAPPDIDGADIDSVTTASLRFASGAVGTLVSGCTLDWKHRAGVEVVADALVLSLGEAALAWRDATGEGVTEADPETARVAVDRAFVDSVRGIGDDIRVPYPEALRTHRLACAVAQSAATGRTVRLAPAVEALATATRSTRTGFGLDA
ncbi:putative dehydrogenase [Micromonospora pisi]|uniref:Putative dehydrogenase n=1 Tax=Micromonospora pisi TaxID=589240 RepID=A0A495JU14_9ACTN|nr:Gfo/Idh/MocA family oxidoreductase [Micromonospora pisi]RKR92500.1 putative dehydrogenase [Micromonospora pisi]